MTSPLRCESGTFKLRGKRGQKVVSFLSLHEEYNNQGQDLLLAGSLGEVHTNQPGVKVLALPVCLDRLIKHPV